MYKINHEMDIDTLESLEIKCFPKSYYSKIQLLGIVEDKELYSIVSLEEDGEILSYVIVFDNSESLEIMKIGTLPEHRKKGLGGILIDEMGKMGKDIFLEVRENNNTAISFYLKKGFEKIGMRKHYYEDTGEAAIIMIKSIKD